MSSSADFTVTSDQKNIAMFTHLAALAGFVIPFGNILGPLFLWLAKRDEHELIDDQGKEVLNFQMSWTIYIIGAALACIILIGIPILLVLIVSGIILPILGAIRVSNGEMYRYPYSIEFLK